VSEMNRPNLGTRFFYRNPNAPRPNQPPGVGSVAVIRKGGSYLLEKRSDSDRWGFPGGRIEDDESAEDAVIREVREETGLQVTGVRLLGVLSDPSRIVQYPDGNIRRIITMVFEASVATFAGLGPSPESEALEFFAPKELMKLSIAEVHIPLVDRLKDLHGWR